MTNSELLNEVIDQTGYKREFIAAKLGMSRELFYRKINNERPFKTDEVKELCTLLNIQCVLLKDKIFFA